MFKDVASGSEFPLLKPVNYIGKISRENLRKIRATIPGISFVANGGLRRKDVYGSSVLV